MKKIQGTNPKPKHFLLKSLTMPIQLQMSSQEECPGCLGTTSDFMLRPHLATCSVSTWQVGQLEGSPGQTQSHRNCFKSCSLNPTTHKSCRNMGGACMSLRYSDSQSLYRLLHMSVVTPK